MDKGFPESASESAAGTARSISAEMPRCPNCGWQDVRFSMMRSALDVALSKFSLAPFRCRSCNNRFYRFFKRARNR
ncbi:MAG: hypothetical protein C5B51_00245 [Terriglobia bacterium]|nr:MAG: hypothetical protein C5B51_00245 [Terriglobia bacterium]